MVQFWPDQAWDCYVQQWYWFQTLSAEMWMKPILILVDVLGDALFAQLKWELGQAVAACN